MLCTGIEKCTHSYVCQSSTILFTLLVENNTYIYIYIIYNVYKALLLDITFEKVITKNKCISSSLLSLKFLGPVKKDLREDMTKSDNIIIPLN